MTRVDRHCGIKGCVDNAVPGAYVEVETWAGRWIVARVECCAYHYGYLMVKRPSDEPTPAA